MFEEEPLMSFVSLCVAGLYLFPTLVFAETKLKPRGGIVVAIALILLDAIPVTFLLYCLVAGELEPSQMTAFFLGVGFLSKIAYTSSSRLRVWRLVLIPIIMLFLLAVPIWLAWFIPRTDWRIMVTIVASQLLLSLAVFAFAIGENR